ncbi:hypothetical protein TNCV_4701161 [Trichonephila clavipes]|nr:hypothetical protein TNCV_4701161 [Trichonephila clavipes]
MHVKTVESSNVHPLVWSGSLEKGFQLRRRPRHLTIVRDYEILQRVPLDAEALKIPSTNVDVSESAMIPVKALSNMPKVSRYGHTIQRPWRLNGLNATTIFESK